MHLRRSLLDLGFLENHVLACLGIKLLNLHFFRCSALVLGRGVEKAGAGGRFKLDFISHFKGSLDFMARAQVCQNRVDAFFVDDAQSG